MAKTYFDGFLNVNSTKIFECVYNTIFSIHRCRPNTKDIYNIYIYIYIYIYLCIIYIKALLLVTTVPPIEVFSEICQTSQLLVTLITYFG